MKSCLYCKKEIEDGNWCSMECKRLFLINHYDPFATISTMQEFIIEKEKEREAHFEAMKKMGVTATEYILGEKNDALHALSETEDKK